MLFANGIKIENYDCVLPDGLLPAKQKLYQRRFSEEPDRGQVSELISEITNAADESEAQLNIDYLTDLFPKRYGPRSSRILNQLFNRAALPFLSYSQPLSTPKPDIIFGYNVNSDFRMARLASGHCQGMDLAPVIVPALGAAQPYFVVEIKSNFGNTWTATNQVAGAGTACVRAAETLYRLASASSAAIPQGPSIAYSTTIVGTLATMFIHWTTQEPEAYHMKALDSFNLTKPGEVLLFRRAIRNVLDWGLQDRYDLQRACMDAIHADMERDYSALPM